MAWKSVLKPENSLLMGAAVAGSVFALYQLDVGPVAGAHASEANHPILELSRKKAGYSAAVLVASLALLAHDPNIVILGGAAIIAMELHYRHAIMADKDTGKLMPPAPGDYQPAENVVPMYEQGQTG